MLIVGCRAAHRSLHTPGLGRSHDGVLEALKCLIAFSEDSRWVGMLREILLSGLCCAALSCYTELLKGRGMIPTIGVRIDSSHEANAESHLYTALTVFLRSFYLVLYGLLAQC